MELKQILKIFFFASIDFFYQSDSMLVATPEKYSNKMHSSLNYEAEYSFCYWLTASVSYLSHWNW